MRSALLFLVPFLVPTGAVGGTLTVGSSGADHTTIGAAIDASSPGDVVEVSAGTYTEDLDFGGKAITVLGVSGPSSTFLVGTGTGPVVRFVSAESNNAVLQGFDVSGGDTLGAYQGAGVHVNNAGPTLRDLVVHDNDAHLGAGVFLGDAVNALLEEITIRDNTATLDANGDWGYGGGLYGFDCTATLSDVTFDNNTAPRGGGFMLGNCTVTLDGLDVRNNDADRGGGVSLLGGATTMTNSVIEDNTATVNGGGFWFSVDAGGSFESVLVAGNTAPTGAGGRITNSSPSLEHVTFDGNTAVNNGGGLYIDALGEDADVAITSCLFTSNEATVGGGLLVSDGSAIVWGSRFSGNSAGNLGGGAYLSDAQPSSFVLSWFDGNSSGSDGGGIRVQGAGPHEVRNVQFIGNTGSNGAAVHVSFAGEANLSHTTMVGNGATSGGSVRVTADSTMSLIDSIIAFPSAGSGISAGTGATWDVSYNNVFREDGPGYSGAMPDLTGFEGMLAEDPLFVDYTPDGVFNDNLALGSSSPCIDAGAPASDTDFDGSPTDQGAFGGTDGNGWAALPDPGVVAGGVGDDDDDDDATADDDDATANDDDTTEDDDDATANDDDATTDDDDDGTLPFDPDPEPLDEGGCGCSQTRSGGAFWAWVLAGLTLVMRRRTAA